MTALDFVRIKVVASPNLYLGSPGGLLVSYNKNVTKKSINYFK